MRITQIETFHDTHICVVRVTADDGLQGIGQTAAYNADITALVLHRQVAPAALGQDLADIESFTQHCFEAGAKFPGSFLNRALCGLDTALWDLQGKREGLPVCSLVGGAPRLLSVYASSMRRDIQPEAEVARFQALRDAHGYRAFKVKIGKRMGHDIDQWPGRTEALVAQARSGLGDSAILFADANSGYSPAKAIEIGHLLESHNFAQFEEPCPWWEPALTAEVSAALAIPVSGGEQDFWMPTWRQIITDRVVDVIQPDIGYIGGFSRALRVSRWAAEKGIPVMPHSASHSMTSLFTAHLLSGIPNAAAFMEFGIEPTPWSDGLFSPELVVRDGAIQTPSAPGWGVNVSPDWLSRATRTVSPR